MMGQVSSVGNGGIAHFTGGSRPRSSHLSAELSRPPKSAGVSGEDVTIGSSIRKLRHATLWMVIFVIATGLSEKEQ